MRLISPLLKHVAYPALAGAGYFRRRDGAGPAVVTYHGVAPAGYRTLDPILDGNLVSAESFRRQLRLLKSQYDMISPEQFLHWIEKGKELPPRAVMLTCDDGLRNHLTDMVPLLREAGLKCLFFVTGASLCARPSSLWYEDLYRMLLRAPNPVRVNVPELQVAAELSATDDKRRFWWDLVRKLSTWGRDTRDGFVQQVRRQLALSADWDADYLAQPPNANRSLMMTVAELKDLAAAGMSIGAHTMSHPVLALQPEAEAAIEIEEARTGLQKALRQEVWALAYPFGDPASATAREWAAAENAGYRCAFVNYGGGFGAPTARFAWPRVHVTADMSLGEFEAHVSGFSGWLRRRVLGETAAMAAGA